MSYDTGPVYQLYGLIEHHGSLSGGHYVAYCLHPQCMGGGCQGAGEDGAEGSDAENSGEGGGEGGSRSGGGAGKRKTQWYYFSDTVAKPVDE